MRGSFAASVKRIGIAAVLMSAVLGVIAGPAYAAETYVPPPEPDPATHAKDFLDRLVDGQALGLHIQPGYSWGAPSASPDCCSALAQRC
jgi:hypothetical protein